MYKLYLINHTQYEYTDLCRSNFSQERRHFCLPSGWKREDDMEVMTEFVHREKLKHRKKYVEVDMYYIEETEDSEQESNQEDGKEDMRKSMVAEKQDVEVESPLCEEKESLPLKRC